MRARSGWMALAALALAGCGDSGSARAGDGAALACEPITYPQPSGVGVAIETPGPEYGWEGEWQSCEVLFPSRLHGSQLYGVLFAPKNLAAAPALMPAVVIAPGSATGVQSQYHYSAREFGGHGYVALTVDPQGVGRSGLVGNPQTADNYLDAVVSALDYLESSQNPLRERIDLARLGAAGHSLSARAISYAQGIDGRIKAIVAWDNLSSTLAGDAGISSGGGAAGGAIGGELPGSDPRPATVLVPAMGQASDRAGTTTQDTDPEVKKTGYEVWRGAGQSAMQLVFFDFVHADWAQTTSANADPASRRAYELFTIQHYTRAWFDYWLLGDAGALTRLTQRGVGGFSFEEVYSTQFRSALYLPQAGIDCADILTGNCPEFGP